MKKIFFASVVLTALLFASCYKHDWDKMNPTNTNTTPTCTIPDTVSYTHDIMPILNANCGTSGSQASSCHGTGTINGNSEDFTSYQHFAGYTSTDSTSNVYIDITWSSGGHNMPQSAAKLSQCDINKIIRWMDQGSLNN